MEKRDRQTDRQEQGKLFKQLKGMSYHCPVLSSVSGLGVEGGKEWPAEGFKLGSDLVKFTF
jgi:hypothetical protein